MSKIMFECQSHKAEPVTNFCCVRTCLTPLCPDCIDEHNKKHLNERSHPEIDTLKRVQKMCGDKLGLIGKTLDDYMNKLNSATNIDFQETVQRSMIDMENMRKSLIEQVNSYFKALQEEYLAKSKEALKQMPDFKDLKLKIHAIQEEVVGVRSNIESQNSFEAIKCTINLDSETLFTNVDKWINDAVSTIVVVPTHLYLKENYVNEFYNDLRNIVALDVKEVKLITNEQHLSTINPHREDEKGHGITKSYFDSKFKSI